MQKWSNNFMAEMLFKSLDLGDEPATYAGAQRRVAEFLDKAKVAKSSYRITNGSGLYDANEISAEALTQLLAYMQTRRDILPEFESSFAIAATDGTLRRRMKGGAADSVLRGKTGTLNRVITLSGYVQTKSGRKLGYSVLFNKTVGGAWGYRNAQNEIGQVLADMD
jgi:D-alanyl-D-alanine carboxypeptidase/D-alanyl-D-alanine-endopeptidase (penicillin-binding protein 4)